MPPTSARDPLTTTIGIGVIAGIWLCCLYSIRQRGLARRTGASSETQRASPTPDGGLDANIPNGGDLDQVHGLFVDTDRPLAEAQRDGTGDTGAVLASGDDDQARLVADDNVTEHDIQEEDQDEEDATQPSHHLKELAYAIARHNTETENTIHHGINCDGCNQHPLRGIRYKCANCHDFDFCERCEATESHLATHVFLKIRIPLVRINVKPARAFYPGRPMHMPSEPSSTTVIAVRKKSSQVFQGQEVGVNDDAVRAAYAKFICLADVPAPHDSSMVERGISFAAFKRLMPLPNHDIKMYDLLFRFYTEDSWHAQDSSGSPDGRPVICFFQYFIGSLIIQKNKYCPDSFLWRIFRCLDADQDGFLSRQDVISALRATHDFNVACIRLTINDSHIAEDALEIEGERDPRTYIEGSGSLGAYFSATGVAPTLGPNPRAGRGKALDESGDLVPTAVRKAESEGTLREASYLHHRGGATISQSEAVQKSWVSAEQDFQQSLRRSASGAEWTAFERTWRILSGSHPNYYYDSEGRLFLKFTASVQIFEGTLFVSPSPTDDKDILEDLKRQPAPIRHREIRTACRSIRQRCIWQNIVKKRRQLKHRQEAGHLAQYEEDPQPQQDEESGNGMSSPAIRQETDSIYNITEEAFNSILDDMFAPAREKMNFEEFYGLVQGRPINNGGKGEEGRRTAYRHVHRDVADDDEEEEAAAAEERAGSGGGSRSGPNDAGAARDGDSAVVREAGATIMEHMRATGRVESKAAKRVCDWAWGWVGVAYF